MSRRRSLPSRRDSDEHATRVANVFSGFVLAAVLVVLFWPYIVRMS